MGLIVRHMLSYYLLTCSVVGTEVELLDTAEWFGSYVSEMLIDTHLTGLRLYLNNFMSLQITAVPLLFELHCEASLIHTCRA